MLTNISIPAYMNLSTVPPLDDVEVDERMHHFKQLLYDLEWKKIKELATSMEAESNKIKLGMKEEMAKIEAKYTKLETEVKRETKLETARLKNLGRLKVLEEMDKNVTDVILAVHQRLGRVDHHMHKKAYRRILYALIVQALCRLLEPEAVVVFRVADVALGKSVFHQVQLKYHQITGLHVELVEDKEQYLPLESCGGVNVRSSIGERTVTNTLAVRLDNVLFKANPMIRIALYGINPNRIFFDLSQLSGSPTLFDWAGSSITKNGDWEEEEVEEEEEEYYYQEVKSAWAGNFQTGELWDTRKRFNCIKTF